MNLTKKFGIPPADAEKIIKAIIEGATNLLLGAGASYGVKGGDGTILKGGPDLAIELNNSFALNLDATEAENLPLVYSDLSSQPKNKVRLNNFLQRKFSNCHPEWQEKLHAFNWKRVWNLNIDDVFEKSQPRPHSRKISTYIWTDAFQPRPMGRNELQVVYLHGRATELSQKPDHLIFSLSEYAGRAEFSPGWHTEFRSEFVQKPFIICGARMQEEYDLATVLEFGNRSRERGGCPSIVVLKSMSEGQKLRFSRQGLIPIETDGEGFFSALDEDINEWQKAHPPADKESALAVIELKAKFKQLQKDSAPLVKRKLLDFYASAETQWAHITKDLDAPLSGAKECSEWLINDDGNLIKAGIFWGGPVSAKTASAFRAAMQLINSGYEIWQFRAEETFNEKEILNYIQHNSKVILLFDDCADYSSSLQRLTEIANSTKTRVGIILTCDDNRKRPLLADLSIAKVKEFSLTPLGRNDFSKIFSKRGDKGRLGRCTNFREKDAWEEFKGSYDCHILEWLESLENAYGFQEAIRSIFSTPYSAKSVERDILCACATVNRFGHTLPFFLGDTYKNGADLEDLFGDNGALTQLGYLDDKGVRLRSPAFSRFVWNQLSQEEKYSWSLAISKALAPLVVPKSISSRSSAYLLLRNLMDWETVRRDLGEKADSWYAALEPSCGWNARFWEQRALLASEIPNESSAYSFAKKAVALQTRDAFTHTTLGKICLRIGTTRLDSVGVDRFWEGVEELDASRAHARANGLEWEHPYITFFTYALKARELPNFSEEFSSLNTAWMSWMQNARRARALTFDEYGRYSLNDFERRWLMGAIKQSLR